MVLGVLAKLGETVWGRAIFLQGRGAEGPALQEQDMGHQGLHDGGAVRVPSLNLSED